MPLYEKIKQLRREGKTPVIKLTPGLFIPRNKLPRGRPRKYPPDDPLAARYRGRRGKNRPRCLAKGCKKMLRVDQEVACSNTCEQRIVNDALLRLRQCRISKSQLLEIYGE